MAMPSAMGVEISSASTDEYMRAPDERARAELARHRIPDQGLPELPAELSDREP